MAWSFVAATTRAAATSPESITSIPLTKPTGTASGHLLVAILQEWSGIGSAAYTAPTGWTLICHEDDDAGAGTGNDSTTVWYKIAGASEPTSYTWTSSQASEFCGGIVAYSGGASSSPVDTSSAANTGTSATITSPAITTVADGDLIVVIDTIGSAGSGVAITLSGSLTSRFNVKSSDNQNSVAWGDVVQTTHGSIASGTYNGTAAGSTKVSGVAIIAFKAASGGATTNWKDAALRFRLASAAA